MNYKAAHSGLVTLHKTYFDFVSEKLQIFERISKESQKHLQQDDEHLTRLMATLLKNWLPTRIFYKPGKIKKSWSRLKSQPTHCVVTGDNKLALVLCSTFPMAIVIHVQINCKERLHLMVGTGHKVGNQLCCCSRVVSASDSGKTLPRSE